MNISNTAARKLAESRKQLASVTKEQNAAHTKAHALDQHRMDRKGGQAPSIVGGKANLSSHGTLYQKKMQRNETATNAGVPKARTILQKQQAAAGSPLFD